MTLNNTSTQYSEMENLDINQSQMYQFIKTERAGEYVTGESSESIDGIVYIIFNDGSRVNSQLIGEYIIPVDDEDHGYHIEMEILNDVIRAKLEGETSETEMFGPDHGKVIYKKTKKNPLEEKRIKGNKSKPVNTIKTEVSKADTNNSVDVNPEKNFNPLDALLNMSKKETISLTVDFPVDVFKKEVYNMLANNFDGAEESMINHIMNSIDMDLLEELIKNNIQKIYND